MVTTDDDKDYEPAEKRRASGLSIFALFGYIMAGLSVVKLIEDADVVELRGAFETWVDAYGLLVAMLADFLSDLTWFHVSEHEGHSLAVMLIVSAAVFRSGGLDNRLLACCIGVTSMTLYGVKEAQEGMPSLHLVASLLILPASIWLSLRTLRLVFKNEDDNNDLTVWTWYRELVPVAAIVALIVLGNYAFYMGKG